MHIWLAVTNFFSLPIFLVLQLFHSFLRLSVLNPCATSMSKRIFKRSLLVKQGLCQVTCLAQSIFVLGFYPQQGSSPMSSALAEDILHNSPLICEIATNEY